MSDDPASKDGLRWEIRRSLIERLRIRWDAMGEMGNQQRYEASVQISLMMDELEGWKAAMQKAERDILALLDQLEVEENAVNHLHTDRNNLRLEIDRMVDKLTAERDDARALYCGVLEAYKRGDGREEAKKRGWYCFEEKP